MNVKAISLKGRIPSLEGIEVLRAEWWDDSGDLPRFVVIRYSEASGGEKSLRMDLDKRIFLDHLTDPEKDRAVQDQVLRVWGIVAEDLREGNIELVGPALERSYTTAILTGTPHASARYRTLQDGQAIDSFGERGSAMAGATTLSRSLPKTLPKLTPHAITDAQLRVPSVRKTPDNATVLANLGLLANLAGTWKGTGFNLVARPDKEGNANLYLELNQTQESLEFTPIASAIPNRGFGMDDIELFGLTYLQQISDSVTGGALHIEPGIWVRQPATIAPPEQPPSGDDIAFRMGSIPHGNAILAKGTAQKFTGPPTLPTSSAAYNGSIFPSFNSTPFRVGGPIFAPGTAEFNLPPPPPPAPAHGFTQYTITNPPSAANPRTPFGNVPAVPLPAEINGVLIQDLVNDPITLLQEVVAQQQVDGFMFEGVALNIASQTPIVFGTTPNQATPTVTVAVPDGGGGIENIPFLQTNADSALVYATFWITTVSHPKRKESFLQLQYAQMVLLNFPVLLAPDPKPNFSWPHITVGTLTRVFG